MANLSNINNILRTSSLGIGINCDAEFSLDIEKASANAILSLNSNGGSGAEYVLSSTTSGEFVLNKRYVGDRLTISSGGDATFAGSVKIGTSTTGTPSTNANDLVIDKGASESGITLMSTAAATIRFGDAANTSIGFLEYNHTSDYMRFGTNATERIRIDSSGNVGIGVTPSSWEIISDSNALQFYGSYIYNYRDTNLILGNNAYYDGTWKYYKSSIGATKFNSGNGAFDFAVSSSGTANNAITWIEALKINSSGNVGIGGGTIEGKLSIDYTAAELPTSGTTSNSAIQVTSSLGNQLNLGLNTVNGSYGAYIQASDNNLAVPYPLNLQPNGGNVGINVSPAGILHAQATSSGNIYSQLLMGYNGASNNFYDGDTQTFRTGIGNITQMTLDSSGNVLVGTDTVLAGGVNRGNITINGASNSILSFGIAEVLEGYLYHDGSEMKLNTGSAPLTFEVNNSERMRISNLGPVLIGKQDTNLDIGNGHRFDSDGAYYASIVNADNALYVRDITNSLYRFYVTGSGQINATSTSISAISDITLKENIKPLETGLNEVMNLKPRRFDWKNGDGENIAGFIAQEVEEVLPDLVGDYEYDDEETKKALKMGDMIPTLVNAIQELKAEIEILKNK